MAASSKGGGGEGVVSGPGPATGGTRGGELREGVVWVGRESYNSLPRSKEGGRGGHAHSLQKTYSV